MTTVTIRELHERTAAIVELATEGHVITVSKRGAIVAEIRPPAATAHRRSLPDRAALLARYPQLQSDSGRILEQDRS